MHLYEHTHTQGTRVKLIVNMIMGTMMGAFSEGMALCKAAEIPQDKVRCMGEIGGERGVK